MQKQKQVIPNLPCTLIKIKTKNKLTECDSLAITTRSKNPNSAVESGDIFSSCIPGLYKKFGRT